MPIMDLFLPLAKQKVEVDGLEPTTLGLQSRCSPN